LLTDPELRERLLTRQGSPSSVRKNDNQNDSRSPESALHFRDRHTGTAPKYAYLIYTPSASNRMLGDLLNLS